MSRIGKLPIQIPEKVSVAVDGLNVTVTGPKGTLSTMTRPEVKVEVKDNLLINGVGYRAEVKGDIVAFALGYSTPIEYVIPKGITITADGPAKLIVSGIDKAQVGKVAAEIRSLRGPEPYKGKGIKYEDETIRRKVGKSGGKK